MIWHSMPSIVIDDPTSIVAKSPRVICLLTPLAVVSFQVCCGSTRFSMTGVFLGIVGSHPTLPRTSLDSSADSLKCLFSRSLPGVSKISWFVPATQSFAGFFSNLPEQFQHVSNSLNTIALQLRHQGGDGSLQIDLSLRHQAHK